MLHFLSDMLINDTYERMPYSSTHENTTLGDTNSKEKTMDASASGDAEKSLVDSAIDWHCFKPPDEIDAIGVSNSLLHHF